VRDREEAGTEALAVRWNTAPHGRSLRSVDSTHPSALTRAPRHELEARRPRSETLDRGATSALAWFDKARLALASRMRDDIRRVVPIAIRIERKRLMRAPSWLLERASMSARRTTPEERTDYTIACATKRSPLRRASAHAGSLQAAKEQNVRRVIELLNGVVVEPGGVFSYHHAVGRPSVLRGFAPGPELRDGELSVGVGGGACQVSNMLYQLGLLAGLEVIERHRHGIDLFADDARTLPFGCGATVFYTMADLRLRNAYAFPLIWRLEVAEGELLGALVAPRALPRRIEVEERNHAFERDGAGGWMRSNRIVRTYLASAGFSREAEEAARNVARVVYEPPESSLEAPPRRLTSDDLVWQCENDRLCSTSREGALAELAYSRGD